MTRDEINHFCKSQPHTTHVVQWGGQDVWKIGGKVFAVVGDGDEGGAVSFKAGEIGFEVLQEMPGLRPAPYLASRGMKWIQYFKPGGMTPDGVRAELRKSYDLVASGLTKAKRAELGLA